MNVKNEYKIAGLSEEASLGTYKDIKLVFE